MTLTSLSPLVKPAPRPAAPAAANHDSPEQACRRAWRLLCRSGDLAMLAEPAGSDPALAARLVQAFDAGQLAGALIEAEVERALRAGTSDATLVALTLLAAVALERFHGGQRALRLAHACAGLAHGAGPVLRIYATLILARTEPLRDAALLQAEAWRLEAARPALLARSAVLWSGMRLLCGAALPELLHYTETARTACADSPDRIAMRQLDGRLALYRQLAGAADSASPATLHGGAQFGCWLTVLQDACLRGDPVLARRALDAGAALVTPLTPPCELLPWHLFAVLALARAKGPVTALRTHRRALQSWARRWPAVGGAMAELARAAEHEAGGGPKALCAYERAAAMAQGAHATWIAALVWERAAGLCAALELHGAAPAYRRLALDAWRDWGAHGRVRALVQAWDNSSTAQTRAARADTVGELGLAIAHEVNQPLAAILLHAAAARRWLRRPEPDHERALEALDQITASGRHAGDIVRSVRGLARRQGDERSRFGFDASLAEVAQLLHTLMLRQGVQLEMRLGAPGRLLTASRAQVQQVAINLLLNAIEALAAVHDRPRTIVLESTMRAPDQLELRVSDNGPGVAPQDRRRIFDALFSTKPHGTGIGLSISRAIAEAHGGRIDFIPLEPHGALFRVLFSAPTPAESTK